MRSIPRPLANRRRFPTSAGSTRPCRATPPAFALAVLLLAAGRVVAAPSVEPRAQRLDAGSIGWSQLTFRATKLLLSATSEVELELLASGQFQLGLIASPHDDRPPGPAGGLLVRLESRLLGRHSSTRVWLLPENGAALQRTLTETGGRHRRKVYRFGLSGVFAHRAEPKDRSEQDLAPESWTKVWDTHYPYSDPDAALVSEPSLLFPLLSTVDPDALAAGLELFLFSDNQLHRVELRADGRRSIKVDYWQRQGETEVREQRQLEAIRVTVRARPLGAEGGEELSLLGLEGDIDIYLDPESRIPLQIVGRVPPIGKVAARLRSVTLR